MTRQACHKEQTLSRLRRRFSIRTQAFFAVVMLLGLTPFADAHHSMARFDTEQEVTIEGVVTRYEWANPHVYIYVEATNEANEAIEWEIEGLPPAMMYRQGWSRDTIKTGQRISVSGNPEKDPAHKTLYLKSMQRADATLYDEASGMQKLMTGGPAPESKATSLEGTWATILVMDVVLGLYPDNVDKTEKGTQAADGFDEETMHPGINCVPFTAPAMMVSPDTKKITLNEEKIIIAGDFDGAQRTVHMNIDNHDGAVPSVQGHSIGRWEGDTLVIDTTHFSDHALGNGFGVPSGSQKHMVEKLMLNEDGKSLTYQFELSDPEFLASTITGETTWAYRPDLEFTPEECDPDNARRFIGE